MPPREELQARIARLEAFLQEQGQAIIQARESIQSLIHPGKVRHEQQHCETPMVTLLRVWELIPDEDRVCFLIEHMRPAERRALVLGLEEGT